MRKLVKLMSITTIATTAALQVTACKDDSKYDSFISDVNKSYDNSTAFLGFLGSADDDISFALQNTFDLLNQKLNNGQSRWKEWVKTQDETLKANGLNDIYLRYYQGSYHQDKPSDPLDAFWNDKNSSWQQNIFTWINSRSNNDNPDFRTPSGVPDVQQIVTKKDGNDKDMPTKLPIVFIVSKGKLITAGQNWISASSSWDQQVDAIHNFVLSNLFLPVN